MIGQFGLEVQGRRIGVLGDRTLRPVPSSTARPVLVLLHAFPLHAGMWEPQLADPPGRWAVVAPDLRGFGGSDVNSDGAAASTIDDDAADVLGVLDQLGFARAVFAGLSMGGYVALAILRRAPDRVAGLVLADTRAEADGPEARAGREDMLAALDRGGIAAIAGAILPKLLGPTTLAERPEVAAHVRSLIDAANPRGIADAIRRLRDRPDASPLLPSIRCPVLAVAGAEDTLTPADEVRAMAARIPTATFAAIEGAGHLASLERPQEFNAVLAAFLAAVDAGSTTWTCS